MTSTDHLSNISPYIFIKDSSKVESIVQIELEKSQKLIANLLETYRHKRDVSREVLQHVEPSLFQELVFPLSLDESRTLTMCTTFSALSLLSPEAKMRQAAAHANKLCESHRLDLFCNRHLYHMLCFVRDVEWNKLDQLSQRLLKRMIVDCERAGMQIKDKELLDNLLEKKKEIAKLQIEFNTNLVEDKTQMIFEKEELIGMSEEYLSSLHRTEDGKYIVTLKHPEIFPLQTCAELHRTRQIAEVALCSKCQEVNTPIFERLVRLRTEAAQILGFPSHADYILDIRMAKKVETVMNFLNDLKQKLTPLAKKEMEELLELKRDHSLKTGQPFDGKINSWDFQFYCKSMVKKKCNKYEVLIRDYFPTDKTLNKIFEMYGEMFGMRVEEITQQYSHLLWHEEVRFFAVYDTLEEEEKLSGYFFLDIMPRVGKYSQNACFPIECRFVKEDKTVQLPVACIVCNFSKPPPGKPPSLKHYELKTLLHEFGHCCHNVLSRSPYGRFSGTNVEKDFAEFPSQLNENWCWTAQILKRLSSHYETGQPLPDKMVDSILPAKNINIAISTLCRIHLAAFDMSLHSNPNVAALEEGYTEKLYSSLKEEICFMDVPEGTNPTASFGHLCRNFDAAFYSYLWSQVFSADVFDFFERSNALEGRTNTSIRYRRSILERGGTVNGLDMLIDFLGRPPLNEAFLASIIPHNIEQNINNS